MKKYLTTLGVTRYGFNLTTKVLDVFDYAWATVVKKDPPVSGMRYKPWSFYEDWLEVFGNDRATMLLLRM
ncbi:hypothetical protein ACS0TY_010786 [Phlomoides rotata]